jgi:5-methylcytosine-specific restriction endonuclease McrA
MLYRRAYMSRSRLVERHPEEGSRKWLVAELDRYTSLIVRRRDGGCVTCGSVQGLQCSHFYSRRYLAVRFNLRNCNAMCSPCNRRHNRDRRPYERYMRKTYGPAVIAELDRLRLSLEKMTDEELLERLNQYKATV